MYSRAYDTDLLVDENEKFNPDSYKIINQPGRNGFASVRYIWSETRTKEWYYEQCQKQNFIKRTINQEYDLLFVGPTGCIFDDDFLTDLNKNLSDKKPYKQINLSYDSILNIYENLDELDENDWIIIGVDSAKTLNTTSDYNAIEIFTFKDFKQIGEYYGQLGSMNRYTVVVKEVIKYFSKRFGDNILLAVEENGGYGSTILENLSDEFNEDTEYNPKTKKDEFYSYEKFIFTPDDRIKKDQVGINTNSKTRSLMIALVYDLLTEEYTRIKSIDLKNQLNVITKKTSGKVEAQTGYHDDLFMACALCAFCRKLSEIDILPLIMKSETKNLKKQLLNDNIDTIGIIFGHKDHKVPGTNINMIAKKDKHNEEKTVYEYVDEEELQERNYIDMMSDPSSNFIVI